MIISNFPKNAAGSPSASAWTQLTLAESFWETTFFLATFSALGEISASVTLASRTRVATARPMQPEPVQRSRIRGEKKDTAALNGGRDLLGVAQAPADGHRRHPARDPVCLQMLLQGQNPVKFICLVTDKYVFLIHETNPLYLLYDPRNFRSRSSMILAMACSSLLTVTKSAASFTSGTAFSTAKPIPAVRTMEISLL